MNKKNRHPADGKKPITIFGPDFPLLSTTGWNTRQAWAAFRLSAMGKRWPLSVPVSPAW